MAKVSPLQDALCNYLPNKSIFATKSTKGFTYLWIFWYLSIYMTDCTFLYMINWVPPMILHSHCIAGWYVTSTNVLDSSAPATPQLQLLSLPVPCRYKFHCCLFLTCTSSYHTHLLSINSSFLDCAMSLGILFTHMTHKTKCLGFIKTAYFTLVLMP